MVGREITDIAGAIIWVASVVVIVLMVTHSDGLSNGNVGDGEDD